MRPALSCSLLAVALGFMTGCRTIGEDEIEPGNVPPPESLPEALTSEGASTWSEWRGPDRNGVLVGIDLPETLPTAEWPELWRLKVGDGLSGIVADGARVYCHSRIDASSGQRIFATSPSSLGDNPTEPTHGYAASPLVRDGKVFLAPGNEDAPPLIALDAKNGAPLWRDSMAALEAPGLEGPSAVPGYPCTSTANQRSERRKLTGSRPCSIASMSAEPTMIPSA